MKKKVQLQKMIDQLGLIQLSRNSRKVIEIDTSDLNRPGLQLSGFYEYFPNNRVQLLGMAEIAYIYSIPRDIVKKRMKEYFSHYIPCVLIALNLTPPEDFFKAAEEKGVPILMSGLNTTKLGHKATTFLNNELAPCIARHGGLMDIFGVGVFLTGKSGVGKSEAMLELIHRGHRLVSDDVVEIKKVADSKLVGSSPETIRHLMEIRGIGLIDVSVLYGTGAIMMEKTIHLNVHLRMGDLKDIDRLGIEDDSITLLGINIPKITVPVRTGRNTAVLMEVAAKNFRLKTMGHVAADSLNQKLLNLLK